MEPPHPRISRRTLLTALGVAAGGGAMLGALDVIGLGPSGQVAAEPFDPPARSGFGLGGRRDGPSVIVIGGGISGLCCAYELGKAGYDVTVLEAADRPGGRNWTARANTSSTDTRGEAQECVFGAERWFNPGPARIAQHHTTLDYCRELGVPVEVFVNANVDAYVEREGVVRRRRSVFGDLDGYISELLAKAVAAEALDDDLAPSERRALIGHLGLIGGIGRPDRGYEEAPGIERGVVGEPEALDELLDLGIGARLGFERDWHQAMPLFHPIGGMDRIVDALVDAIGSRRVRLSHVASELADTGDGVVARTAKGSFEADWGICCIQPGLAANIENSWDASINQALREPQGVATGKIGLEYDERFWETEDRILGGTTTTSPDVRVLWYPSTDYLSPGGVIVGAYPFGRPGTTFDRLRHAEREALAIEHGAVIHGERYGDDLISSFSVGWSSVPHIQAAWTTPLSSRSLATLREPQGRWLFAGDWMSYTPGWQHGAFESARHAVTTLHEYALRN